jgi:acetylornithine deacetylase
MAHKGFVWGEVLTSGKSAHGSRWDLGVSAITKMGKVIVCLDEFDRNVLRQRTEDLVGPASMHVSLIRGGVGVSTYAQECRIHLERRTLPSENMDEVKRELERVILNTDERAQVNWYFSRPPFSCDRNEPIVHHVIRAAKAVTGLEPEKVGWGVWTDAAVFKSVGIPTVNIGPSGFGLHEPVEWVDFESVVSTAEILIDTANSFCSK